jgi:hypothetical protein
VLIQSASPEAVGLIQRSKAQPKLTDNPAIQAALAGLEKGAADGQILQLFLISPLLGIQAGDPSSLLLERKSFEETVAALKAATERNRQGIPPYFTGFVADVQFGEREGMVLSLAYPDCASAAEASAGIEHFWKADGFNDKAPAEITMIALPANEQLCAAAVTLRSAGQDRAGDGIFTQVRTAIFKREFTPLRIGLQPKTER